MKNFDTHFAGLANMWKEKPVGSTTWFSAGLETGFHEGRLEMLSTHLWLFGFQIFEFSMYRKR